MRRLYETRADRIREHAGADEIREAWRCGVWVLPPGSILDYELFGPVVGWGEFKGRNIAFGHYPDVMYYVSKWDAARECDPPAYLFFGFTDGLYYTTPDESNVARRGMGGRTDRGDPADIQPCVWLKNDGFHPIGKGPKWVG